MKTIELKWIEDEDQKVAQDAFVGLQELIDDGVFPTLKVKEEDKVESPGMKYRHYAPETKCLLINYSNTQPFNHLLA